METQLNIPCCCFACDNKRQDGHFVCYYSPQWALLLESLGYISRYYNGTSWVWIINK